MGGAGVPDPAVNAPRHGRQIAGSLPRFHVPDSCTGRPRRAARAQRTPRARGPAPALRGHGPRLRRQGRRVRRLPRRGPASNRRLVHHARRGPTAPSRRSRAGARRLAAEGRPHGAGPAESQRGRRGRRSAPWSRSTPTPRRARPWTAARPLRWERVVSGRRGAVWPCGGSLGGADRQACRAPRPAARRHVHRAARDGRTRPTAVRATCPSRPTAAAAGRPSRRLRARRDRRGLGRGRLRPGLPGPAHPQGGNGGSGSCGDSSGSRGATCGPDWQLGRCGATRLASIAPLTATAPRGRSRGRSPLVSEEAETELRRPKPRRLATRSPLRLLSTTKPVLDRPLIPRSPTVERCRPSPFLRCRDSSPASHIAPAAPSSQRRPRNPGPSSRGRRRSPAG